LPLLPPPTTTTAPQAEEVDFAVEAIKWVLSQALW
jgi:hypothetical protein